MAKENVSLDFRLKKNTWNRKLSFKEIKHDLISEKHKRVCGALNY